MWVAHPPVDVMEVGIGVLHLVLVVAMVRVLGIVDCFLSGF